PATPWSNVLEASEFSSDCAQPPSKRSKGADSEDCLYINVWRPAVAEGKPLPVMVWIYGGALTVGGASLYPGDGLAAQGIVYVSFNYRLGRFGFFAHPALASEDHNAPRGNYGYMDQVAALKWVKHNIAAFGGDPNNVTIAGESAGGGSVLALLSSPMARGLFQRAILQSPGLPTPRAGALPMRSLVDAEKIAVDYARSLGVDDTGPRALTKLRALPTAKLYEGLEDRQEWLLAAFGDAEVPGMSFAIVDGRLVPAPPEVTIRAGRQAPVPVIVGANDADLAVSAVKTPQELFALFGPLASQARTLYDPNGDASLQELIQNVIADRSMVEPSRNLAELTARAGEPAYFYRFSYVPEVGRATESGAPHGSEIPFAFDRVAAVLKDQATARDLAMAKTISGYWVDFVKTGNPNRGERPEWQPYDPTTGDVLNFTNTGVKFGPDPLKARLDLWRSVWEKRR
ncbi:MAG TPA: carboxylesterase family protein, partial [Myxococcota bacterium]|nr:carboxylesterase family protein [Myxococcota bacterium]